MFGPELIFTQSLEIGKEFGQNRVRRADAGDSWISLSFSRDRSILISWDSECYGVCRVSSGEIRELEAVSVARPPIVGAVKSHIVGADLWSSAQLNRDRVLKLEFRRVIGAGFYRTSWLICELCGRYSNVIIADEDERVIEAAKHILPEDNRYRVVAPGSVYAAPPPVEGISIDCLDISNGALPNSLSGVIGIGKPLIRLIEKLKPEEIRAALNFIKTAEGSPIYQICSSPSNYLAVSPVPLFGASALIQEDALSAARCVVLSVMAGRGVSSCRKKVSALLKSSERANAKKIEEYELLVSGREEIERLKREGQLILANAHAIPRRAESVLLTEWSEDGPSGKRVSLDPEKDASANAEARFVKYRRKKNAAASAAAILPELYRKRNELREQRVLLECNSDLNTLSMMAAELERPPAAKRPNTGGKKQTAAAAPYRRREFADFGAILFYGLSAKGNRYVTFKLAKAGDIWFHAQGIPGAHVILRFEAAPGDTEAKMINIAASCAAFYSGARGSGGVRVDYADRRHVRAIQDGGAANVTYKEFSTTIVDSSLWREYDSENQTVRMR